MPSSRSQPTKGLLPTYTLCVGLSTVDEYLVDRLSRSVFFFIVILAVLCRRKVAGTYTVNQNLLIAIGVEKNTNELRGLG